MAKAGGCEKSPLHQEHSNINTVGADAPGGPAERILNNTLTPGESVTLYVFAGGFLLYFWTVPLGPPGASAPTLSIDFFHSPFCFTQTAHA